MTRFVPNGSALAATPDQPLTRRDLAVVLVGSAEEYGFDQRSIRTTPNGFYVSDEQYKLLFQPELKALGYSSIFSPKVLYRLIY